MKTVILTLSLAAMFAGCASNNSGMGGTGDQNQYMYNKYGNPETASYNSSGRFHSNAVNGTGSVTATNSDRQGLSP